MAQGRSAGANVCIGSRPRVRKAKPSRFAKCGPRLFSDAAPLDQPIGSNNTELQTTIKKSIDEVTKRGLGPIYPDLGNSGEAAGQPPHATREIEKATR